MKQDLETTVQTLLDARPNRAISQASELVHLLMQFSVLEHEQKIEFIREIHQIADQIDAEAEHG